MAAFASGLICAHASLVFGASVLLRAEHGSRVIYGVLAAASLSLGLWTLVRSHGGACCNHVEQRVRAPLGGTFLSGAALGFVVSPCCTPMIAAMAALSAASGGGALMATFAAFALGQVVPLAVIAAGYDRAARAVQRFGARGSVAVVNGALLVAVGGYYGLLA
jgi:cytochrome c biogenesis protein CcdA